MLSAIGNWLTTVPVEHPWRAIVVLAEVFAFAFALHLAWEAGFALTNRLRRRPNQ